MGFLFVCFVYLKDFLVIPKDHHTLALSTEKLPEPEEKRGEGEGGSSPPPPPMVNRFGAAPGTGWPLRRGDGGRSIEI